MDTSLRLRGSPRCPRRHASRWPQRRNAQDRDADRRASRCARANWNCPSSGPTPQQRGKGVLVATGAAWGNRSHGRSVGCMQLLGVADAFAFGIGADAIDVFTEVDDRDVVACDEFGDNARTCLGLGLILRRDRCASWQATPALGASIMQATCQTPTPGTRAEIRRRGGTRLEKWCNSPQRRRGCWRARGGRRTQRCVLINDAVEGQFVRLSHPLTLAHVPIVPPEPPVARTSFRDRSAAPSSLVIEAEVGSQHRIASALHGLGRPN
jgi:hypothetical protein